MPRPHQSKPKPPQRHRDGFDYAGGLILVFTFAAALAAAVFTARQAYLSGKQLRAAREALHLSQDNEIRQLRAYVSMRNIDYLAHRDPSTDKIWWTFTAIWENSGSTFTKKLFININSALRDDILPEHFEFPPASIRYNTPVIIGPRSTIRSDEIAMLGDDLNAVLKHTKYFYIWGWARYRDVFQGTPDRITKFCISIGIRGDPTKIIAQDNIVEMRPQNCPKHNCADEDCE